MPFFSTVRMPLVVRRSVTQRFSVSTQKRCVCRFGRKRRRFLLLAWETRLPTAGFLPVISQTRDMRTTRGVTRAALYTRPAARSQGGAEGALSPAGWGVAEAGGCA